MDEEIGEGRPEEKISKYINLKTGEKHAMCKANQFLEEEEAVSPVIGVILMVAITVILAAVIAAFVFGMGPPEQAPQASIRMTDVNANNITLQNQGGDPIDLSKTTLTVTQGDNVLRIAPMNATGGTEYVGGDVLKIDTNTGIILLNGVQAHDGTGVTGKFSVQSGGQQVSVTLIDTVSGQMIANMNYRV